MLCANWRVRHGFSDIVKRRSLRAFVRDAGRRWVRIAHSPVSFVAAPSQDGWMRRCLSASLDRRAVGPISKQAGLSNQCPPGEPFAEKERSTAAAPSGMGIDNESDQVP